MCFIIHGMKKTSLLIISSFLFVACSSTEKQNSQVNNNSTTSNTNKLAITTNPSLYPANPPIVVSSTQLAEEYSTDAKKADDKYKFKTLEVTGKVKNVPAGGDLIVELEGSQTNNTSIPSIKCHFFADDIQNIGKIAKDQQITVLSICYGKTENQSISLESCTFK